MRDWGGRRQGSKNPRGWEVDRRGKELAPILEMQGYRQYPMRDMGPPQGYMREYPYENQGENPQEAGFMPGGPNKMKNSMYPATDKGATNSDSCDCGCDDSWESGLCDLGCEQDSGDCWFCCWAFVFPPYAFYSNIIDGALDYNTASGTFEKLKDCDGKALRWAALFGVCEYYMLCFNWIQFVPLGCVPHFYVRRKINEGRLQWKQENPCCTAFITSCCGPCALIQERKHMRSINRYRHNAAHNIEY